MAWARSMRARHHQVGQGRQRPHILQATVVQGRQCLIQQIVAHSCVRHPDPSETQRWACRWLHPCPVFCPAWRRQPPHPAHHPPLGMQCPALWRSRAKACGPAAPAPMAQATPMATLASNNAPVFRLCIWRNSCSVKVWPTLARSMACPLPCPVRPRPAPDTAQLGLHRCGHFQLRRRQQLKSQCLQSISAQQCL